ncbi:NADH pyrophosphatase [Methylopila jiangsuensis]|uniref:NAD(+) diphosphatase n=1 Tax=Methylopila jiangsuensis TaxID=586230 RepID=A0A9W6N452_9HYPH|nr:NAD(+) diphosphatase [Methylopila jiangsuensis]MDR6286664.1 NAD+ diphosphatase [Methylopila jiangsuensis]GLK76993.1 NADH pyrophosphatase [Methylopila jiangsuensis]
MPDLHALGYAGLALDRCGERRDAAGFLERAEADAGARLVLFAGDRPALRPEGDRLAPAFGRAEAAALGAPEASVFLGLDSAGRPCFAERHAAEAADRLPDALFEDLRTVASDGRLAGPDLALVGYARAMLAWHARNGFCANCGAPTRMEGGGWRRGCPACGALHFPRTDPVAIMLVTHAGRCLLGRQARFPPGVWSCLAGFVEPGETLEDAARREIFEEAGVRLGPVAYAFSQPWPFPSQLMLGVTAEALGDALTPDVSELEALRWFSRDEAASLLTGGHPDGLRAPPPAAIAHHLLRLFVDGADAGTTR